VATSRALSRRLCRFSSDGERGQEHRQQDHEDRESNWTKRFHALSPFGTLSLALSPRHSRFILILDDCYQCEVAHIGRRISTTGKSRTTPPWFRSFSPCGGAADLKTWKTISCGGLQSPGRVASGTTSHSGRFVRCRCFGLISRAEGPERAVCHERRLSYLGRVTVRGMNGGCPDTARAASGM
jgi:hypothetical protein